MSEPTPPRVNPFAPPAVAGGGLITVEQQRAIAEVQAAMIVARSMPRNVLRAEAMILQECTNPELAEEASYAYNRGGSEIEAPSIRLAETMARHWGNMKSGVRELERHDGHSVVQAYAQDLETGYMEERTFHVAHWRDTKTGGYEIKDERDIYENNANQGARRKRACILALIPMDIQAKAMRTCATTLAAEGEVPAERVEAMLARFAEFKVTREMIERRVGRTLESVPAVVFIGLQRIFNSLRDRISTVDQWFEVAAAAAVDASKAAGPKGKLKGAGKKARERAAAKVSGGAQQDAGSARPTQDSLLADVKAKAAKAAELAAKDLPVALLTLDDAKDFARSLEGEASKEAQAAITTAEKEIEAHSAK